MKKDSNHQLELPACLENIGIILQTVTDAARASGMGERNVWKLETSLDEACTNIVCYGYQDRQDGLIWVKWKQEEGNFIVTLEDQGIPFDQSEPTTPDLDCDICQRKVGGLGRYIMSQFLDQMTYQRVHGRNRLVLVKTLQENKVPAEMAVSSNNMH